MNSGTIIENFRSKRPVVDCFDIARRHARGFAAPIDRRSVRMRITCNREMVTDALPQGSPGDEGRPGPVCAGAIRFPGSG